MALADKLTERGTDDIEEQFGFVLMLDGLGVSSLDQQGQRAWLDKRNEMIRYLDGQQQFHLNRFNDVVSNLQAQASQIGMPQNIFTEMQKSLAIYKEIHDTSSFATFGDTVIFHGGFSIDHTDPSDYFSAIAQTTFSVIEVMKANIKFDLRLRGSFALGNYLVGTKSDTIMGNALIEAYESYERANWIGIVAAPGKTEQTLEEASSVWNSAQARVANTFGPCALLTTKHWWTLGVSFREIMAMSICDTIAKYPVCYKEIAQESYTQREMWTPAWPVTLHLENMKPEDISEIGMDDKPQADIVFSTIEQAKRMSETRHHQKYDNTIAFYENMWANRQEFLDLRKRVQPI